MIFFFILYDSERDAGAVLRIVISFVAASGMSSDLEQQREQ
jgi:hypothetical protein